MSGNESWGVPDWCDEGAYPRPAGRSRMLVWAWEFLRRNPDYRRFWFEEAAQFIDEEGCIRDGAGPVMEEAENRFGVTFFPQHPASTIYPKFSSLWMRKLRPTPDGTPNQVKLKAKELGYAFDLTLPLEGQFARALSDAKTLQKIRVDRGDFKFKYAKERSDKYVTYLRILDAEDCSADKTDVADVLFPSIENTYPDNPRLKTYRNHLNAAIRLRDEGYRSLASLASVPGKTK